MKRFAVFSGFLGSGKTTTMMKLTKYYAETYGKAAMISNDLGHGVQLADHQYARLSGCHADEITDNCICYVNEQLADRLDAFYGDGCELVVSDIPGFGVGALEHVYHGLTEKYPGEYDLAPFTVLVEPQTIEILREGRHKDLTYIYHTQLVEADLIVLNKCDLLLADEVKAHAKWLSENYPQAKVMTISALTGDGMDGLARELREGKASMRRPDISYGGETFRNAMGHICEYYHQYVVSCSCCTFNANAYLADIASAVQKKTADTEYDIPHLKILAWTSEGDFGKVDMIGADRDIEVNHEFLYPCDQMAVIINLSGICDKEMMDLLMTETIAEVSEKYHLSVSTDKKECFGML